ITSAAVEFRVPKQWLLDMGFNAKQVLLFRHSAGSWDRMRVVVFDEDSIYYYYSADLPAFSLFAIAAEKFEEAGKRPAAEEALASLPNATAAQEKSVSDVSQQKQAVPVLKAFFSERRFKLAAAAVVAVIALFAILFFKIIRKLKEQESVSDFVSRTFRKGRK
ncbi:MAG: PGF-pre-PGF domain-containing protein, partial [Nanoarchaeota archaeon]